MADSITPSPELIEQWMQSHSTKYDLARQAAQWGANQELEACSEWLVKQGWFSSDEHEAIEELRAARRPRPPSLKEQALVDLNEIYTSQPFPAGDSRFKCIRRALEALPNDAALGE
jgi:hypothetical protein